METLMIGISTIGFVLALGAPFIIMKVLKFKLEIEKIRSETEIKKEEIRARNQYEIEKMLMTKDEEVKSVRKSGFEKEELSKSFADQEDFRQRIRA